MSISNSLNDINPINNNTELSKNAIQYLSKQIVNDGEKKIIEQKFIFQIIYSINKINNWYCCSLMDQSSKFGGFCIQYIDKSQIPKKGDIIEVNNIQIIKLPSRENHLYFCDNVKLIHKENKENTLINKIRKKSNNIQDEKKNNEINHINIKINKISKTDSDKSKKVYTLVKEIMIEKKIILNPVFYLKCQSKSIIKNYEKGKSKGLFQSYHFLDTEGDYLKILTFSHQNTSYFDNIIHPGNVYEISK